MYKIDFDVFKDINFDNDPLADIDSLIGKPPAPTKPKQEPVKSSLSSTMPAAIKPVMPKSFFDTDDFSLPGSILNQSLIFF